MNSSSEQSYMDKLKTKNVPPTLRKKEEAPPLTVQIRAEDWRELMAAIERFEFLSNELMAQREALAAEANQYTQAMTKAAEAQRAATEKAMQKAAERVGNASERASEVIDRRILRDEFLWWLRLALTAIPVILVLLLWARVGFGI